MRPRHGGSDAWKLLAGVGAIALGGVIAGGVLGLVTLILAAIGIAFAGVHVLGVYAWIMAAAFIYRAIRSRLGLYDDYYHDDEWHDRLRDALQERAKHVRRRLEQAQRRIERAGESVSVRCERGVVAKAPQSPPEGRQERSGSRGYQSSSGASWAVVVAVLAGLLLTVAAGLGLSRAELSPLWKTLAPTVFGASVGLGIYGLLSRYVMPPPPGEHPPTREVRAQVKRIRRKASRVRREVSRQGGVFNSLDVQAAELANRARELCERLVHLRKAAREVRREMGNPAIPRGVREDALEPEVQSELEAARTAQRRLDDLVARNRRAQRLCLAQLERIEDLLDVARLELACPADGSEVEQHQTPIVQEFETELIATRQALEEVQTAGS